MDRTRGLALLGLLGLAGGWAVQHDWRRGRPSALSCPPGQVRTRMTAHGPVAFCGAPGAGQTPPPAWARTVGERPLLNQLTEEELAAVPGVGRRVAHALVGARQAQGGFRSWDEVDQVPGVGPAKLALLRTTFSLDAAPGPPDAGR